VLRDRGGHLECGLISRIGGHSWLEFKLGCDQIMLRPVLAHGLAMVFSAMPTRFMFVPALLPLSLEIEYILLGAYVVACCPA